MYAKYRWNSENTNFPKEIYEQIVYAAVRKDSTQGIGEIYGSTKHLAYKNEK